MESQYWWITTKSVEQAETGYINFATHKKFKDFNKFKRVVWKYFRSKIDIRELAARDKLVLWAICEKYNYHSCSCKLSYSYLAKMLGLSRHTISKAVLNLSEHTPEPIIWIAIEGSESIAKKRLEPQKRYKTHLLLVGLNQYFMEELEQ